MPFEPNVTIGQILCNEDLAAAFGVSTQGGMRRSLRNDCLVIITDPTAPLYKDRWLGKILFYTGMGKKGDQGLDFAQNRTLAKSKIEGTSVFLFEAQNPAYKFEGEVELVGEPFQEAQKDEDGRSRNVWVFPLSIVNENGVAEDEQEVAELFPDHDAKFLEAKAKMVAHMRKERNGRLVKEVKAQRSWVCEICGLDFEVRYGVPYVEAHHKEPLYAAKEEREATRGNLALLCANCHRAVHKYMARDSKETYEDIRLVTKNRLHQDREQKNGR